MDYDRIRAITRDELGLTEGQDSLIQLYGGQGIRQGLEDKAKDAAIELLIGTDARAEAYKAALYDFLKNAAAGPLANVLGAHDAWGQARRDELKDVIREVLEENLPFEDVEPEV